MILVSEFKSYLPLYAVDLATYRRHDDGHWGCIDAVWFRKVRGVVRASAGQVRGHFHDGAPFTARGFLEQHTDNRHGGDCYGRWDGTTYWGYPPQTPDAATQYLNLLRLMLAGYPAVPEGYDGWWGFR